VGRSVAELRLVASGVPRTGDTGLMLALGPGFAAEMLAIAW